MRGAAKFASYVLVGLLAGRGLGSLVVDILADDPDTVSVECAAAHVVAVFAQHEYGSSTYGIPNRQTDEGRDALFFEGFDRLDEACGGFTEPYDFWLLYTDLVSDMWLRAATEYGNPEFNDWYRETICPTFDNPEDYVLCTEGDAPIPRGGPLGETG